MNLIKIAVEREAEKDDGGCKPNHSHFFLRVFSCVLGLVYSIYHVAWLLLQPTPAAQRIGYDIIMKAKRDFFLACL